jgi:hypothetical protein
MATVLLFEVMSDKHNVFGIYAGGTMHRNEQLNPVINGL